MPPAQQVFEPDERQRERLLPRWSRFKLAWKPVRDLPVRAPEPVEAAYTRRTASLRF